MKTLEQIQKDYQDLALKREQIVAEMYRLEGEARLLSSEKKVDEVVEEKS